MMYSIKTLYFTIYNQIRSSVHIHASHRYPVFERLASQRRDTAAAPNFFPLDTAAAPAIRRRRLARVPVVGLRIEEMRRRHLRLLKRVVGAEIGGGGKGTGGRRLVVLRRHRPRSAAVGRRRRSEAEEGVGEGREGREACGWEEGTGRPKNVRRLLALLPFCAAILKPYLNRNLFKILFIDLSF